VRHYREVKTALAESNAHQLTFTFKLTKPIDANTVLHFVVTKPSTDPKKTEGVKSMPFPYTVSYVVPTPTVTSVAFDKEKVTLKGTALSNLASHPAALSLSREGGHADDKAIAWPSDATATAVTFDVPSGLTRGCWDVNLKWNTVPVNVPHTQKSEKVSADGTPTIKDAKRGSNSIQVTGSDLADTTACGGGPVKFQLTGPNGQTITDVTASFDEPTQATVSMPAAAKTGDWFIRLGADDTTKVPVK
jgi:hypothetical protein